jgi:hypothetical protein
MWFPDFDLEISFSSAMKKYLGFVLFCATSFCVGYLVGVPFSKSPSSVSEAPVQGDAQHRGEFVSVASHAGEPQTTPKTINTTGQKAAPPSNPAAEIRKLTLPEVQARLQEMNGMEANAQVAELEHKLVARWSELDPIGAAKYAANAVAQGAHEGLLREAAGDWAKTDPIAASQWAATLDSPKAREIAVSAIFGTWSETNPAQAASAIATLPVGSAQNDAASAVAIRFARANLNAAVQWAEGLSGPVQVEATKIIVSLWSTSDPEATGAWIMRQGSPQVRKEALGRLALKWVERDPSAAIDYAQKISDVGLRNEFVQSAVSNFSRSDPVAAANWLSSGAVKLEASSAGVRGVSENYAKLDPGAAARWASSITDSALRNNALSVVAETWSETNPAEAANWLSSGAVKLDASSYGVRTVSENYAKLDPGAAARWASSITDGALRNKALSAVSKSWSETNPTEAAKWVGSLQDVQVRDIATVALSQELAKANPASAAQWASRISDPAQRSSSLSLIVYDWKKIDPNAARAFVLSSTAISDDERKRLLR